MPERIKHAASGIAHSEFQSEYDLDSLVLVQPRGPNFSMYVTPRYRARYEENSYEELSANLLTSVLRRMELFIDVGAHYGFYSLLAATRHKQLEVLAFEPVEATFNVLERNLALTGVRNVSAHQLAVSASEGAAPFNISLASDNCGFYRHPNAPPLRQLEVHTTTIDSVLKDRTPCRTLVKIDVDGHELAVLEGMAETCSRFDDLGLVIEFNPKMQLAAGHDPEDLLTKLDQLGFAIFLLDDTQLLPFRVNPEKDWRRLISVQGCPNLYCMRKEKALSVCFFSHSAELGGAERSLLELVTQLISDHGTICAVVVPGPGPLVTALNAAGAGCIVSPYSWWCDISPVPEANADARLHQSVAGLIRDLLPLLAELDIDAILTQTLTIPWGATVAALLAKPHVWSVCEYGEHDHDLKFFQPFEQVIEDIVNSSAIVYTATNALGSTLFPDLSAQKRRPLYRHIEIPETTGNLEPEQSYFRTRTSRLALFASVQENKGQEDAVLTVAQLVKSGRSVELLLAGSITDAAYHAKLEALIEQHGLTDRVQVPGFLPDPYPAMREADIVLSCSRNEAFGRTVVEAMLLSKPVIYPNVGGFAEYMIDGKTGYSYQPGDVDRLAETVCMLLDNPERARTLGEEAHAYATGTFDRDNYTGFADPAVLVSHS